MTLEILNRLFGAELGEGRMENGRAVFVSMQCFRSQRYVNAAVGEELEVKSKTDRRINDKEGVMAFERITVNPVQMGGVPCIRGLRIPVATVVGMIADGMAEVEILKAYPDLEHEDLREALLFAAEAVREREIPLHRL